VLCAVRGVVYSTCCCVQYVVLCTSTWCCVQVRGVVYSTCCCVEVRAVVYSTWCCVQVRGVVYSTSCCVFFTAFFSSNFIETSELINKCAYLLLQVENPIQIQWGII
jgi:hypothetical protein